VVDFELGMNRPCASFKTIVFGDELDGRGDVHLALSQLSLRLARWTAEQGVKAAIGHREAGRVIKIAHVQTKRSVGLYIDEVRR